MRKTVIETGSSLPSGFGIIAIHDAQFDEQEGEDNEHPGEPNYREKPGLGAHIPARRAGCSDHPPSIFVSY
jgi:hypothetical protein